MSQRVPSCEASAATKVDQYNYFATPTYSNTMFYGTKPRNELADNFLPTVPEYDQVAELTWKDGHPAMQDLGSRAPQRQKSNCYDQAGMVLTSRCRTKEVEGTLDAIVARTLDVPMQNLSPIDEEMASWLHYTELQENPQQKTQKNPEPVISASKKPEFEFPQSMAIKSFPINLVSSSQSQSSKENSNLESMNFSHFSKPAVLMKAQLHTLGSASGPTNIQRVRQYGGETEVAASNPMAAGSSNNYPPPPPPQFGRKSSRPMDSVSGTTPRTPTANSDQVPKVVEDQSGTSATFGKDLNYDAMEVTLVSTSHGSHGNSVAERGGKEPIKKRKSRGDQEDSEDQDDGQSAQAKKPQTGRRSNTGKKTRAAAVHNQSERRRRDRINERMKALQKLIPNSSKTDKASMLDEAIEYLKHLQAQLQMMCLRNGMNIPPMMLPLSMQQLQMSMLASIGPMGLGMGMAGMGLGMGMGMMDMNSAANTGRAALVPMGQPLPGAGSHAVPVSVHPVSFIQPNFTVAAAAAGFPAPVLASDANDRLKNSVDPYSAFMACQRQSMNMNMNMNMDLYNSMALLQQQQQLHHHHQQQSQLPTASQHPNQQQQQQHQINNSK